MNNSRIIDELRSSNATLIVLVLALCAQIPHAADVFRLLVPLAACDLVVCAGAYIHSYLFAVALEMAVLLFVVRGKERESYAFAVVSVAMNLAYYGLHSVSLFSMAALPAWLVSVALPSAIALYSHVVADGHTEQKPAVQRTRTTRVTRTDEQSETVTGPVQVEQPILLIEQSDNLTMDVSELTIEQKRAAAQAELRNNPKINRTKLAKRYEVGRTTLYAWISELQPTEATR